MQIFVAHDFAKPPLRNYRRPFLQTAKKYNVDFQFADEVVVADHLLEQIEKLIEQSDFCLFDVSKWNRNVMFELGFARGRDKKHCLLFRPRTGILWRLGYTEGFPDLPSDLKGLKYIEYRSERSLKYQLYDLIERLVGRGADLSRAEDILSSRVEDLIYSHPECLKIREIAADLKIDQELAKASVKRLLKKGRVEMSGYGPHTRYCKPSGANPIQAAE